MKLELGHAIAYTRGGEAVVLGLGTMPLPCENRRGMQARPDEQTILFELTRQLFDSIGQYRVTLATSPRWRLTGLSLVNYPASLNPSVATEDPDAVIEMPDNLATRGGRIKIRYRGERMLHKSSDESKLDLPLVVEGEVDVRGCGDLPEVELGTSTLSVTIGNRTFPIRSALARRDENRDDIVLSTLPRSCAISDRWPGDLSVTFRETDPTYTHPKSIAIGGTLARSGPSYPDRSKRTPARIPAKGPFELAIDMDATPDAPIAIHGKITAERCKDW